MIGAYASSSKFVLVKLKAEQKSNEIATIPELIKMFDIERVLVTIDTMACQTKIAETIVEQGVDCLLTVENNQGSFEPT